MIPSLMARGLYNLVKPARQVAARQNTIFWFSFFVFRINAGKRTRFVEMKSMAVQRSGGKLVCLQCTLGFYRKFSTRIAHG